MHAILRKRNWNYKAYKYFGNARHLKIVVGGDSYTDLWVIIVNPRLS